MPVAQIICQHQDSYHNQDRTNEGIAFFFISDPPNIVQELVELKLASLYTQKTLFCTIFWLAFTQP
jgi:hypothetical protein